MKLATRLLAHALAFVAVIAMAAQPAAAQSGVGILRDAETEKLLQDMVDPLVEAAGIPRGDVEVVLTNDPSINAFVENGQRIYINAGLINAADTANEVQGVLAHELGHIVGGHSIRSYEAIGKANTIALLSTLVGIAAAVAGAGDAAIAGMTAAELREAVALVGGRVPTEASGGVRLDTIGAIAATGVDYVSVGRLTQSAPAADIGLDFTAI